MFKSKIMRYLLLLFTIIFCTTVQSQEATITYSNKILTDTTKIKSLPVELQKMIRKNAAGENYYLYIKEGQSLYTTEVKKEVILKREFGEDHSTENISIAQPYSEVIYTDKNKNSSISKVTTGGSSYLIKEPLVAKQWEMLDEVKTINGYECRLAETTFYGKKIQAWYTESIDLRYGPSWFQNLPGLIVQLEIGKRVITLTEINYAKFDVIEPPITGIPITREKYDAMLTKSLNVQSGKTYEENGSETIIKTVRKY